GGSAAIQGRLSPRVRMNPYASGSRSNPEGKKRPAESTACQKTERGDVDLARGTGHTQLIRALVEDRDTARCGFDPRSNRDEWSRRKADNTQERSRRTAPRNAATRETWNSAIGKPRQHVRNDRSATTDRATAR